jgi:putative two-component system response regulator
MEQPDQHHILIVDDEEFIRRLLNRLLTAEGYWCDVASSGEDAVELLQRHPYSLAILDISMPGMSGMELLHLMRHTYPETAVIMVTGVDDRAMAVQAVELGTFGYVIKPFESNEVIINVVNALERRRLMIESRRHEIELAQKVQERTAELRETQEEITLRLVAASEYRDEETGAHIKRMGLFAAELAAALGWEGRVLDDLRLAAPMHDIGKIGVPDAILRKPGRLTTEEFEVIKSHTVIGGDILASARVPLVQLAHEIAFAHHEKWDGSGYPYGLAGEGIPAGARIVAVADVYDALTHPRVYRPAVPEEEALAVIREGRGRHFDPEIVDAFFHALPGLHRIREEVSDQFPDVIHA